MSQHRRGERSGRGTWKEGHQERLGQEEWGSGWGSWTPGPGSTHRGLSLAETQASFQLVRFQGAPPGTDAETRGFGVVTGGRVGPRASRAPPHPARPREVLDLPGLEADFPVKVAPLPALRGAPAPSLTCPHNTSHTHLSQETRSLPQCSHPLLTQGSPLHTRSPPPRTLPRLPPLGPNPHTTPVPSHSPPTTP